MSPATTTNTAEQVYDTDAVVDADGTVLHAVAVTIEAVPEIDDPLAIFEATFGSGADLWASPEGRTHLEEMRGGV